MSDLALGAYLGKAGVGYHDGDTAPPKLPRTTHRNEVEDTMIAYIDAMRTKWPPRTQEHCAVVAQL